MDPSKGYSPTTSDPETDTAMEKREQLAIHKQNNPDDRRNSEAILEAIRHKKHVADWDGSGVDFSQVDEKKTLRKMDVRL